MNGVLWWLAQNTIAIVFLIGLVASSCRLFRSRPAVQHVLWSIVLLKFITPPVMLWPVSLPESWPAILAVGVNSTDRAAESRKRAAPAAGPITSEQRLAAGETRDFSAPEPASAGLPTPSPSRVEMLVQFSIWTLTALWLCGAAIYAARQCRRITRHARLVNRAAEAPALLKSEVEAIARQVGLRPPRALVARGIASPFMWFLGNVRLIWPETMLSREAVVRARGVIAHELAHVRRGDHFLAWVDLLAGVVWWWNPLFWFVRRRIRESAELACDAIALAAYPDGRRAYAELLLELSAGLAPGVPAPALGMITGSPTSFERRLSMILSERVSGKMSRGGVIAAGMLAIAALPGWSFAQKPVATGDERSAHAEPEPGVTAARIQHIEAELKRLSSLFEKTDRTAEPKPNQVNARAEWTDQVGWHLLPAVATDDPSTSRFRSDSRHYVASAGEKSAEFRVFDNDKRLIWHAQPQASLPGRIAGGGEWVVSESVGGDQVVFSWTFRGKAHSFSFDTASGKMLSHDIREITPGSGGVHSGGRSAVTDTPPHQARPAIVFGRGHDRIYILNTRVNDETKQCFLSAQTDHARQVWRSTFFNPLLSDRFQNAWRNANKGERPSNGFAGNWEIEESENQKEVVVTWTGSGMRVKLLFEFASGKLHEEYFMGDEGNKSGGDPLTPGPRIDPAIRP